LSGALAVGCSDDGDGGSDGTSSLETDDQQASYAIGVQVGTNLRPTGDHLDLNAFRRGMNDALAEAEPALTEEQMMAASQKLQAAVQEEQATIAREQAEANTTEGQAYLAENGAKDGVVSTESGRQYEVLRSGDGATPAMEDAVTIHYRGTLIDGTEFDSSYERDEPATFTVNGVIPGFSEGLQLMPVGSQYRFVIPGDIAYGPQGTQGMIGPNQTLIFEVELIEIAP
jgi:FKBP-type peptidyl-prolyl cis-trans isomerase